MQRMHTRGAPGLQDFADPVRNVQKMGIEHGMKVADFGAGSGAYALAIADLLSGSGKVYAIDVQKDLLRKIQRTAHARHLNNVEIIWGDLEVREASKLPTHSIDKVLMSNILFQMPDKAPLFTEAKRIVKKDGTIIVIDWSDSFGGIGPHPEDVVSESAVRALGSSAGLRVVEEFSAGAHHYGLVFAVAHP